MRTRHVRVWVALAAATVPAAWSGAVPVASAVSGAAPRVAFSENLGDGRILTRFTNGVTVVATQGTQVVFEAVPGSDREGGTAIGLIPPDYDEAGTARAAQAYRAAGRSSQKDQRALGYSQSQAKAEAKTNRETARSAGPQAKGVAQPTAGSGSEPGEVYDTGCAEVDSSVFWKGCYRRYRTADNDPKAWYTADESQGTGHGKGAWYLRTGRTDHRYSQAKVVQWEPTSDVPTGRCDQVTFSLGAYGVSMSRTTTVCPEKISINVNDSDRFFAQWNGAVRADNPGVVAQDFARVPAGKGSGFEYWVYEYHTVY